MGKRIDLTGQRFGRLVVINYNEEVSKQKKGSHWNCKCDCGNESIVWISDLKKGKTQSCGCLQREKVKEKLNEMWDDNEFRQKQSDKMKKLNEQQWKDEEFRSRQSDKLKEQWKDEEFRRMQSDRLKEQWKDEEFRQMMSENASKQLKAQWKDEETKWKFNYKGGITPISAHLRLNKEWFVKSKQEANYTCQLTGKHGGLHTHHLYAFSSIVMDAHNAYNIEIKQQVKDYTEEELKLLEEYVAEWHKDTSNAVVLSEEAHMLFHNLYGRGDNTPEQYEEFKQRYLDGEFKSLL